MSSSTTEAIPDWLANLLVECLITGVPSERMMSPPYDCISRVRSMMPTGVVFLYDSSRHKTSTLSMNAVPYLVHLIREEHGIDVSDMCFSLAAIRDLNAKADR